MTLEEDFKSKDFVITTEINPPKSFVIDKQLAYAKAVAEKVSAINITDNSGAGMKVCSLVSAFRIESQAQVETIWQITCRDRNRLGLQSDILGAINLGLRNILVLRGDAPVDPGLAAKCFDLQTDQLLEILLKLQQGYDYEGKELTDKIPKLFIGAASHPGLADLNQQKQSMLKRLDLGVNFFQTQICFDKEQISKFIETIGEELAQRTLLGVTPLKSFKQAQFIEKNIFGVTVPQEFIETLGSIQESEAQMQGQYWLKDLVDFIKTTPLKGIHLMAIGQEHRLAEIVEFIK